MDSKGNANVAVLFGALIFVVLAGSLAPTMFGSWNSSISGAPTWLITVMPICIAGGFVLLVWRAISGRR